MNHKNKFGDSSSYSVESPRFHFGDHLRHKIANRGLSIREAARRIGVKHPQMFRWLGQSYAPKQITLDRIARGLECPVTDLLPPASNYKDTTANSALTERIAELERNLEGYRKEMDDQIKVLKEIYILLKNHSENNNPVMALNGIQLRISELVLKYEKNRLFGVF